MGIYLLIAVSTSLYANLLTQGDNTAPYRCQDPSYNDERCKN
jgi:hypothetical protein